LFTSNLRGDAIIIDERRASPSDKDAVDAVIIHHRIKARAEVIRIGSGKKSRGLRTITSFEEFFLQDCRRFFRKEAGYGEAAADEHIG